MKKLLVFVVGPTAIGNTSIAIDLATHFNTEIISCDSRQFYKEMNILKVCQFLLFKQWKPQEIYFLNNILILLGPLIHSMVALYNL